MTISAGDGATVDPYHRGVSTATTIPATSDELSAFKKQLPRKAFQSSMAHACLLNVFSIWGRPWFYIGIDFLLIGPLRHAQTKMRVATIGICNRSHLLLKWVCFHWIEACCAPPTMYWETRPCAILIHMALPFASCIWGIDCFKFPLFHITCGIVVSITKTSP